MATGNLNLLRVLAVFTLCAALVVSSVSAQGVPTFVSGSANISLTNETFTGRTTVVALTSPSNTYELVLIQDGFGTDTKFQYCWTEVHDTASGLNMTWREPCNPKKVDYCSLVLTSDGDFRLAVEANGAKAVAFTSQTEGDGVVAVHLTDQGDLLLVKSDNSSVWTSYDHLERQGKCKREFNPSSGARRLGAASFVLLCTVLFSLAISFSF